MAGHGEHGDRRVARTTSSLRHALHSLIGEKPYEAIGVKEILGRANVGRSTFYAHFRGKDELLLDGMYDLLRSARPRRDAAHGRPGDRLLWFSRPILDHIADRRAALQARGVAAQQPEVHQHLQRVVADLVIAELGGTGRAAKAAVPDDLLAQHIASTFVLVLNWWLASDPAITAGEADAMFRALVVPARQAVR